jgi:hypothetical protein
MGWGEINTRIFDRFCLVKNRIFDKGKIIAGFLTRFPCQKSGFLTEGNFLLVTNRDF